VVCILIGLIGKPSAGKSSWLNAACMTNAKIGNYPFTTIEPNLGTGYVKIKCVCQEFNVKDNPKNSLCVNGYRYIPVKLIDVAGLVPDAHLGKGLGNKFLSDLSKADVLLHILDTSGELDPEGNELNEPTNDPLNDIIFLEHEINLWFKDLLFRTDWKKFTNKIVMEKQNFVDKIYERLSGISIKKIHIIKALENSNLNPNKPNLWSNGDIEKFAVELRKISKPIVIIANKIDKKNSEKNFNRLKGIYKENIIPSSALAELVLRNYAEKDIIKYTPGDSDFKIIRKDSLNSKEIETLNNIKKKILKKYGSTGIQRAINYAVFDILKMIVVYPVYDEKKLTDKDGNVLPDAHIVPLDMNIRDFVKEKIHSDLAKNFIYAIDARSKIKLGKDYILKNNDVIKIVSAAKIK